MLNELIGACIIGIVLIILGILNVRGNISSIHWYHRHRVQEKDRLVYGKFVGSGTIIIGGCLIVFSIFSFMAAWLNTDLYITIGSILLIIGIIIGFLLNIYAMIKYNKGLF